MRLNRSTGGGADRKGRVLVVETQTTTEDLLKGGTLAAEAGESAFAVSEEEHVAETAGNGLVYRFVKRAFDIAFSLCVVVVGLAPIALLLLIIRLESPVRRYTAKSASAIAANRYASSSCAPWWPTPTMSRSI